MSASDTGSSGYTQRLGLPARPRLEDLVGRRGATGQAINLFQLMIAALIERGAPTSLVELARRLEQAGARSPIGNMELSLKKGWKRREPIYERPDGLLALNVTDPELDLTLFVIGLRPARGKAPSPPPPPAPVPPPSATLSVDEVRAAFKGKWLRYFSYNRVVAAILDAHGRAMAPAEVEAFLAAVGAQAGELPMARFKAGLAELVAMTPDGLFALDLAAPGLPAMRTVVRKLAAPTLRYEARDRHYEATAASAKAISDERTRQEAADAASIRRCVVRVIPDAGPIAVVAVVDIASRQISSFDADSLDAARDAVAGYDLVAAVKPRDVIHRLGLEIDRFRVLDLGPPSRELRFGRGRPVRLTPELVVASTTGIPRPFGDARLVATDVARRRFDRLRLRADSDARALVAQYRCVQLHGHVLVRWRREVEVLTVGWPIRGDVTFHGMLVEAARMGAVLEFVAGTAPSWDDPWARAFRVRVTEQKDWSFAFEAVGPTIPPAFSFFDVTEARLVSDESLRRRPRADGRPLRAPHQRVNVAADPFLEEVLDVVREGRALVEAPFERPAEKDAAWARLGAWVARMQAVLDQVDVPLLDPRNRPRFDLAALRAAAERELQDADYFRRYLIAAISFLMAALGIEPDPETVVRRDLV